MASRRKKVAFGCGIGCVALLGGFLFLAWPFFFPETLPGVVSIRESAEYQDAALLQEAWRLPVAATYRDLYSQENGSLCGPTSVANVLRSRGTAGADADRVLDGAGICGTGYCIPGITLDQLASLARHAGAGEPTVLRDLTPERFREHLGHANDPDRRYLINFDRGPLFGRRGGHHSPIGGYLADQDLVLVLDVNATYGPWLVDADRLYEAMNTVDSSTGKKRGLVLLR